MSENILMPSPRRDRQLLAGLLPAGLDPTDRTMFRDLLLCGGIFFLLAAVAYVATISWATPVPRDGTTLAVGRDFLNFWMYGRSATSNDPSAFYDIGRYHAAISHLLGYRLDGQNWSYPPSVMLFATPFGQLGYLPALAIWTLLGPVVFFAVARRTANDWRVLLPVLLSPAALMCLVSGQSSFLTGAIIVAAFALMDRRPLVAGCLIGLLTIKPQLGMLFPFFLIASGRWRMFAAASVTTVALVGVTAAVFGSQVWVDFVARGLPVQGLVLADPDRIATPFFPTVFMNLRGLDASYALAMSVQAAIAAAALVVLIWAAWRCAGATPSLTMALFLTCSVSASPYLLSYDLLPLTFAATLLLSDGTLSPAGRRLAQLVYWTPALQLACGTYHIPGPALIAPLFAGWLATRLWARRASGPRPVPSF